MCRPGFEKEVVAELQELTAEAGVGGYFRAKEHSAVVYFVCYDMDAVVKLITSTPFQQLVFVRHWMIADELIALSDPNDRVSPLADKAAALGKCQSLQTVVIDTNEGKSLTALTKSIAKHLQRRIDKKVGFSAKSPWILQLLFVDGQNAYLARSPVKNISSWEGGIPRLRSPKGAPSRATLKLEEAWHHFIPRDEWDHRLMPGAKAVDLGAAPGGWTWQLVQKSMFVEAVDNGPMHEELMESGQVTHHREDGFAFTPKKSVYWLVCDIADKPARVASLISRWATHRWCTEAVFNLKLPMKKRFDAVAEAKSRIEEALQNADIKYELNFKQLYHDREEVTGHLRIL